ncbi:MAG: hypothetical protein WAK82_03590 [Streptosporangiaceae bacterium]
MRGLTTRRNWPDRVRVAAWSVAGLTLLLLAAALVLLGLDASRMSDGRIAFYAITTLTAILYAGTGRLIATRVPRNAIGWLLGLIGLSLAAIMATEQYALYGLAVAPGALPAARLAGWLSGVATISTFAPMVFLVLLFPDGRLPSRRWRPLLWLMFAVLAGWTAQQFQAGTTEDGGITNALEAVGVSYPNPLGVFPRHGPFSDFLGVLVLLGLVAAALVVASVFARRRGASAEVRKQLAWLGYVGLFVVIPVVPFLCYGVLMHGHVSTAVGAVFWGFILLAPTVGIPVACTMAVLKYRLYEIDRLISRTVSYAIVTGLLVGVYAGLILLITEGIGLHAQVAVAAATLAAATLFTPLRVRVQRRVDRRFNRARYDAERLLADFAARLKDAVDPDAVRADLLDVVHTSLEPTHAGIWIRQIR